MLRIALIIPANSSTLSSSIQQSKTLTLNIVVAYRQNSKKPSSAIKRNGVFHWVLDAYSITDRIETKQL